MAERFALPVRGRNDDAFEAVRWFACPVTRRCDGSGGKRAKDETWYQEEYIRKNERRTNDRSLYFDQQERRASGDYQLRGPRGVDPGTRSAGADGRRSAGLRRCRRLLEH